MNEFKRHQQTSINVQKQANLIWNVADILRGLYKPHEYGKVILPMTVIKRLHDTLLKTRDEVIKTAENTQSMNSVMRERLLKNASGYSFYNTSLYTFETLLADQQILNQTLELTSMVSLKTCKIFSITLSSTLKLRQWQIMMRYFM